MYETMIDQSDDVQNQFYYSCLHCPEKFISLFLLKQHHEQFHAPKFEFDQNIYSACVPKKQSRVDWEKIRKEDNLKLEHDRARTMQAIQRDLGTLKTDLGTKVTKEISTIVEDKHSLVKTIDSKMDQMTSIVESLGQARKQQALSVESLDNKQDKNFNELKSHMDLLMEKYKTDLTEKMRETASTQQKEKTDLLILIDEKTNQIDILNRLREQNEGDIVKMNAKIKSIETDNAHLLAQLKDTKSNHSTAQTDLDNLRSELTELRSSKQILNSDKLGLIKQLKTSNEEQSRLTNLLKEKEGGLADAIDDSQRKIS